MSFDPAPKHKRIRLASSLAAAICALLLATSAFALPRGTIRLKQLRGFEVRVEKSKIFCYQKSSDKIIPGRIIDRRHKLFRSLSAELADLKHQLRGLSGKARKKKRKAIDQLTNFIPLANTACTAGAPTATPTTTPAVTVSPTPTSTPTPVPPAPTDLHALNRPLELNDIQHLYRRAGLGAPDSGALAFVGQNVSSLVQYFMTYRPEPDIDQETRRITYDNRTDPPYTGLYATTYTIEQGTYYRLLATRNQFHERLAYFVLHNHLATSSKALDNGWAFLMNAMEQHLNLIRSRGAQLFDYAGLVEEMGEDVAMMAWLNIDGSRRQAPNQNYARELMELFSLDVRDLDGNENYTIDDIREIARAFTGWRIVYVPDSQLVGHFAARFFPEDFDSGEKVIFRGTQWEGRVTTSRQVVQHIFAHHPNAAVSLARMLVREYVGPDAPRSAIEEIAQILRDDQFNMRRAIERILTSELFFHIRTQYSIAITPTERMVHWYRSMLPYYSNTAQQYAQSIQYYIQAAFSNGSGCILTSPATVFGCNRERDRQKPKGVFGVFGHHSLSFRVLKRGGGLILWTEFSLRFRREHRDASISGRVFPSPHF